MATQKQLKIEKELKRLREEELALEKKIAKEEQAKEQRKLKQRTLEVESMDRRTRAYDIAKKQLDIDKHRYKLKLKDPKFAAETTAKATKLVDLEKSLVKGVEERKKKARKVGVLNKDNSKVLEKTLKAEAGHLEMITQTTKVGDISLEQASKHQELVESLSSGELDLAGILDKKALIENEAQNAKTDAQKAYYNSLLDTLDSRIEEQQYLGIQEQKLQALDDITGNMASNIKEWVDEFKQNPMATTLKASGSLQKILAGGVAAAVATMVGLLTQFSDKIDSIGEVFGQLSADSRFRDNLLAMEDEAVELGYGMEEVTSIVTSLSSQFGMTRDQAIGLSGDIMNVAKATGMSVDESTALFGNMTQIAGLSEQAAGDFAQFAFGLADAAGVAPASVMQDISSSAEDIANFTMGSGENIAKAAVQAAKLGVSLGDTAKVVEGLLDMETSLGAEMEASVMIGRQLNFQKARELALNNDIAGAMAEVVGQLGSQEEFERMNVLQRKALADAIGVSTAELAKFVKGTDDLTLASAMAAGNFEELAGRDALSSLSNIINKMKAIGAELLNRVGPALENAANKVLEWMQNSENVEKMKNMIVGMADALAKFPQIIPAIIKGLVIMKGLSIMIAAANAAAMAFKMGAKTFGIGALAAIGIIGSVWAAAKTVGLAEGGLVQPTPGGTQATIGEGGEAELVTPLSKVGNLVNVDMEPVVNAVKSLKSELQEVKKQVTQFNKRELKTQITNGQLAVALTRPNA